MALIGSNKCGLTSLVKRFLDKDLPKKNTPTLEERFQTIKEINGHKNRIEVIDTSTDEKYQNLFAFWINTSDGLMLVFSVDDKESFNLLKEKHSKIVAMKDENFPLILVGNKSDIKDKRMVDASEAERLADSWKCKYYEVSAKENKNCKEPFIDLAEISIGKKREMERNITLQTGGCCDACNII